MKFEITLLLVIRNEIKSINLFFASNIVGIGILRMLQSLCKILYKEFLDIYFFYMLI